MKNTPSNIEGCGRPGSRHPWDSYPLTANLLINSGLTQTYKIILEVIIIASRRNNDPGLVKRSKVVHLGLVIFLTRGVARLFKMRGRQGGSGLRGGGADWDSKWQLSIDLCTKCNFISGATPRFLTHTAYALWWTEVNAPLKFQVHATFHSRVLSWNSSAWQLVKW